MENLKVNSPSAVNLIFIFKSYYQMALVVKNLLANAGDARDRRFDPRVWNIPWSRKWHSTPVFLPGKFHGQGSLVGHRPWGLKE